MSPLEQHWALDADEVHYEAAGELLSLLVREDNAEKLIERLRKTEVVERSVAALLTAIAPGYVVAESHIQAELARINADGQIAPVLLIVAGDIGTPLIVADGLARIMAADRVDEISTIACKIVHLP